MTKKLTILAGKHMTYQYTLPQLHRCVTEVRSAMPPTHCKQLLATLIYTNIFHKFQFISKIQIRSHHQIKIIGCTQRSRAQTHVSDATIIKSDQLRPVAPM